MTPARWIDGPRAGQRHVERDQADQDPEPRPQADPEKRERGCGEQHQQEHVLAADRQEMRETRAAEALLGPRVDAVVLPEDEAEGERALAVGHPARERSGGTVAYRVEPAGDAVAAARQRG